MVEAILNEVPETESMIAAKELRERRDAFCLVRVQHGVNLVEITAQPDSNAHPGKIVGVVEILFQADQPTQQKDVVVAVPGGQQQCNSMPELCVHKKGPVDAGKFHPASIRDRDGGSHAHEHATKSVAHGWAHIRGHTLKC